MLLYQIALTLVPGIGDILGKKLVVLAGSAEAVFKEPRRVFAKIHRSGDLLHRLMSNREIFLRAEKEIEFIERYGIRPLFFTEPDYPQRNPN
jgi:DNA processing protein